MTRSISTHDDKGGRYGWVDIAKGICILAVVGLYVRNEMAGGGGDAGWLEPWSAFARPFRMPDFFLLSGLFLSAVLDRPWKRYLDTKVVHYVYFLVIWTLILLLWDVYVLETKSVGAGGPVALLKLYVFTLIYPDHMLWFIQSLPVFFVVTRLLRRVPPWLLWLLAAAAMVSQFKTGRSPIDNFLGYYVYFLTGHFAARWIFALADRAAAHGRVTAALFIVWCVVNQWAVAQGYAAQPGLGLFFGLLGVAAIVSLSSLLAPLRLFAWLRVAGNSSITIYLGFFIPVTLLIQQLTAHRMAVDPHLLATLAVVVGASVPWLLARAVRGSFFRFLFVRPAWAHLVETPRGR
ncbi:MAG: hypothetical protein RL375_3536 [Pseudomonadota bacterium]